jgi:hypothetical protein
MSFCFRETHGGSMGDLLEQEVCPVVSGTALPFRRPINRFEVACANTRSLAVPPRLRAQGYSFLTASWCTLVRYNLRFAVF